LYAWGIESEGYDEFYKTLIPTWYSWFPDKQISDIGNNPDMMIFLDSGLIAKASKVGIIDFKLYKNIMESNSRYEVLVHK
jgi:hypothetical protein